MSIDQRTLRMLSRRKNTQNKSKTPYQKSWKDMKNNKKEKRKKGFHPSNFRKNHSYQQRQSKEDTSRKIPPVECWICKENHFDI